MNAQVQNILRACAAQIPMLLRGKERLEFISNEILPKLPEQQKMVLVNFFNLLLLEMRKRNASDLDLGGLGANRQVWLRVEGTKAPVKDWGMLNETESDILILAVLSIQERMTLLNLLSLDFSYVVKDEVAGIDYRFRGTAYFELHHLTINMRAINATVRPIQSYGFHPHVLRVLSLEHTKEGLILVTGITGAGKSTTLDAIIDFNNRTMPAHIVVIASPVEYIHTSKRSIVKHREVGEDTLTFKTGAIESLRQDPDMIVIGEMRDPDTMMAALEIADSGHKVLSTLHTSSAVESIDRIIGEMPPGEQQRVQNRLADVLRCVISQKLIPGSDGRLVLAKEILVMTPSIRAAIKNNNTSEIYQMIAESKNIGMNTLEQDLHRLFTTRKISMETALNFANNKRRIKQLLHDQLLLSRG
jgi:twitching motility protein PilT